MRACKTCGLEKEYNYFTLDARGRKVYKDAEGYIWHGRVCAACFKLDIQARSRFDLYAHKGPRKWKYKKHALEVQPCLICGSEFKQKHISQSLCEADYSKKQIVAKWLRRQTRNQPGSAEDGMSDLLKPMSIYEMIIELDTKLVDGLSWDNYGEIWYIGQNLSPVRYK